MQNTKKNIINKWSGKFIGLSVYSQNKVYKIVGPFIVGIDILSLPRTKEYRPMFVCYPLWKSNIEKCLEEPIILQEITNKKGLQFNIPYTEDTPLLNEAINCSGEQAPVLLSNEINVKQLFDIIDYQFSQTLIKSSPVAKAKLLEAKLMAALYVNDKNLLNAVWKELNISKKWPRNLFEWKYGKLEDWIVELEKTIINRSEFLKKMENNKQTKKILNLKTYDLKL